MEPLLIFPLVDCFRSWALFFFSIDPATLSLPPPLFGRCFNIRHCFFFLSGEFLHNSSRFVHRSWSWQSRLRIRDLPTGLASPRCQEARDSFFTHICTVDRRYHLYHFSLHHCSGTEIVFIQFHTIINLRNSCFTLHHFKILVTFISLAYFEA
jgi:hypothetical protein